MHEMTTPTFQEIISKLTNFWAKQSCVMQQGHDIEVGAGTFNPATFLRSLGPEPFNTMYVEPSRRPQDGRFGENPNRLQLFHQFQVLMKPSPLDIQEKYIDSLKAIGFDLKNHDLRFVHDDWESPTLGAWGLGWEVWLDGMEVTQFTYFQSVAGLPLNPISVELTYGLERLCMALQKKNNFFDMMWNEHLTYGDIFHRNEVEWSHYNFYHASTEMWLRHFEDFEKEAKTLIELNLPIPAYDFVMKASHAFNMLEARGVLSVTERTGYITRVRDLAKMAAAAYLKSRESLGYPLLKVKPQKLSSHKPLPLPTQFDSNKKDDFLLEIGSEELPATFIPLGCRLLEEALKQLLEKNEVSYESLEVFGTPRRLSAIIKNLSHATKEVHLEKKGPPLSLAFDESGRLTKQGAGFFQSLDLEPPKTLQAIREKKNPVAIQTIKDKDYLFAQIKKEPISAAQILSENLPKLITELKFPKQMRWSDLDISYARPLHWIVALHGNEVIPFSVANIHSDRTSYGHRQLNAASFNISHASNYLEELKRHFVQVNPKTRKQVILEELKAIESKTNTIALEKENVLKEVLYLSEWPELFYGTFNPDFLKAPEEVLTSEMIEHQRYFPLAHADGRLSNLFVITADNTPNETIKTGNEHVLSARLSDGVFLYEEDRKTSLSGFKEKLKTIIFQKDLGTLEEKTLRLKHLCIVLAQLLGISTEKKVGRAASLAKADLASELVQEFPNLQGTIGKYYALDQGEDPEVALALEEQWMPKFDGDFLPSSETGTLLSLADKLDNLIGYFSVGLKPSSSSDPYALRRQTIGIIKILIENSLSLDLGILLKEVFSLFPKITDKKALSEDLLNYVTSRAKGVFEDYQLKKDEIEATLQGVCIDPYDQFLKTKALHAFRKRSEFNKLYEVYKRAKGQLEKEKAHAINPELLQEEAELALFKSLNEIKPGFKEALEKRNYEKAFSLLAQLQGPLARLFDEVLILAKDHDVRQNRLALLQDVIMHFGRLLDFGKIQVP